MLVARHPGSNSFFADRVEGEMRAYSIPADGRALLAGMVALALASVPAARGAEISLGAVIAAPSGSVAVPVVIASGGVSVSSVQFDLSFDSAALSISAAPAGSPRSANKTLYTADLEHAAKRYLITGRNSVAMADGSLITLFISVRPEAAEGFYTLRIFNIAAADGDGQEVSLSAVNGQITVQRGPGPSCLSPEAVLNAASLLAGPITPGQLITIMGCIVGAQGASVRIEGQPAHVLFAGGNQVNAQAPAELPIAGTASIEWSSDGISQSVAVPLASAAPGVFTRAGSGAGAAVILNEDGTINTPEAPAAKGSLVTIYGTGVDLANVSVAIGGEAANVTGASALEDAPGVVQVQARVPDDVASGSEVSVVLVCGQARSQEGVTLSIP